MNDYPITKAGIVALDDSIEHWKRLVDLPNNPNEIPSIHTCALCTLSLSTFDNICKGCPVNLATGAIGCRNTPYNKAFNEYYDIRNDDPNRPCAEEMLNCLLEVKEHGILTEA